MEQLIAIISNMEGFVKRTHFYTKSWLFAFKILLKKLFLYKDQIFVTTDIILNKNFLQILLKISVAKKADVLAKEKNCWVYNMVKQMISETFLLNMRNSILNSQAPDLPCAAVGHVFRLSRPRFGSYLKTVKKYPLWNLISLFLKTSLTILSTVVWPQ